MVLTIKSYEIDAVGNTETLFACTALLSVAALAGGTNAAQPPIASVIVKCQYENPAMEVSDVPTPRVNTSWRIFDFDDQTRRGVCSVWPHSANEPVSSDFPAVPRNRELLSNGGVTEY